MSPRKWDFRLQDMLDAARKIELYIEGLAFEDFVEDEKTFDAVVRQLTVLGEAACHVPESIAARSPEIPWSEIRGMRNISSPSLSTPDSQLHSCMSSEQKMPQSCRIAGLS